MSRTRSPRSSQTTVPPRAEIWRPTSRRLPSRSEPVGRERRVRRAGHRVLVDAPRRREHARDEVPALGPVVRCGAADPDLSDRSAEGRELLHVGRKSAHLVHVIEDGDHRQRPDHMLRLGAERLRQRGRSRRRFPAAGREVQHVAIRRRGHPQRSAQAPEHDLARPAQLRRQHVRAGQGRVAAERDLLDRREPADVKVLALWNEEGGLRKVVLAGDLLQQLVAQPPVQRHDRRRIALERRVGEGVDLVEPQLHGPTSDIDLPSTWTSGSAAGSKPSRQ